jgi:hypothetical protein
MSSSNTAFQPQGLSYALSVAATQANATTPVGFTAGGNAMQIYNSGTNPVCVIAYQNSLGVPTLVFPVTGAPPVGEPGTVVAPGATIVFQIPANADSFSAIGLVAGPSIIYVQRGEGI